MSQISKVVHNERFLGRCIPWVWGPRAFLCNLWSHIWDSCWKVVTYDEIL